MIDINKKKKDRYIFLHKLYEESGGNTNAIFNMWEVGQELNLGRTDTGNIVDYLIGENLIDSATLGGGIQLTHWGIKEVEEALENPDKPTEHFLPINIINIGTMNNSALQQGSHNSSIVLHFDKSKKESLDNVISSLKGIQDTLNLSMELYQELISEIQTLESQSKSPKPKSGIIAESLGAIKGILQGIAGNSALPTIIGQISHLLH